MFVKSEGKDYRSIWFKEGNPEIVQVIDQRKLPFEFAIKDLKDIKDVVSALRNMMLRGAGCIEAAAGCGMYLATLEDADINWAAKLLKSTRPTAVNLACAVNRQLVALEEISGREERIQKAFETANDIMQRNLDSCWKIGEHGFAKLFKKERMNILTKCNAGGLSMVDRGSATAPIYEAHDHGVRVHVWVCETRPKNQGLLTRWELEQYGVSNTLIIDDASGDLMQNNKVDMVIVGADRVTAKGDVANKIGTYSKALEAQDNDVPFYVAFPLTTVDWSIKDGLKEIPIEERDPDEVMYTKGLKGKIQTVPNGTNIKNRAFDITEARLITAFITEKGIIKPNELIKLRP